ncbi:MAG TPA: trigger factor [Cyanobacteria bacterium UBA11149]|nr:trigger factor [Cyanobacteria bacterium UBA11367]HBE60046.1 trigger factor [Cyanobacteria bacterium UBA11366]HBK62960.1 trigger factor [Cyanobacteria bacterium UBA11166]HBR75131.1 trigger factor [Cyanobacteria bacterium UBA11159]HBS68724.1 trigger factor [Cyanobacteria bacterium UBA11153]HBW91512.1 trigger factor [Cyanobacteria bacterium UBA11149]HCA96525.1 trigger factor [Cyanobacteria bacterium UBA9226]
MKVTQEKLPKSQIGLEIEIPAETTRKVYEQVVQNLTRSVNIPGFRKGKVPRQILLQRLGAQRIKESAVEDLVQNGIKDAIAQETIEALGNYKLISPFEALVSQFQPGEPITISASVDVPPEVKLGDYSNISVKVEETTPDPDGVDKFLQERRVKLATLIPVESRPAQMGDVATVDYQAVLVPEEEGEAESPVGEANDFQIELEENAPIPNIVEGIVGMNPGETKEVPTSFPDDYGREDLAGKSAKFTITLKEIKEKELPELDDEFAEEISDMSTMAELRESLTKQFAEAAEKATTNSKEQAVLNALLEKVEIELPETLIDKEIQTMLTQTLMQMESYGLDVRKILTPEMIPEMRERSRPDAIKRLKESFTLKQVAKEQSITVTPEEIQTKSKELMEQLAGQDVDPNRLEDFVKTDLLQEKALQWLAEHATIELVPQGSLTPEATEEQTAESEPAAETSEEPEV